jgi:hypothetical protein
MVVATSLESGLSFDVNGHDLYIDRKREYIHLLVYRDHEAMLPVTRLVGLVANGSH